MDHSNSWNPLIIAWKVSLRTEIFVHVPLLGENENMCFVTLEMVRSYARVPAKPTRCMLISCRAWFVLLHWLCAHDAHQPTDAPQKRKNKTMPLRIENAPNTHTNATQWLLSKSIRHRFRAENMTSILVLSNWCDYSDESSKWQQFNAEIVIAYDVCTPDPEVWSESQLSSDLFWGGGIRRVTTKYGNLKVDATISFVENQSDLHEQSTLWPTQLTRLTYSSFVCRPIWIVILYHRSAMTCLASLPHEMTINRQKKNSKTK